MKNEYISDKRITDVSGDALAGKVPLPNFDLDGSVFIQFTDGTFVYGASDDPYEGSISYEAEISMHEAHRLGLLPDAEYVAWKVEYDVWYKASMVDYRARLARQFKKSPRAAYVDCRREEGAAEVMLVPLPAEPVYGRFHVSDNGNFTIEFP